MVRTLKLKSNSFQSAKASVNRGKLYGPDKIRSLADKSFDEILKFLEETDFKDSIDKSFLKYEGFYLIETILNDHLSKIYSKIISSATGSNKILFEEYYMKYQIHNFMVVIRCLISKEDKIEPYLIGDSRKKSKFIKAFSMSSSKDAISYLSTKLKFDENKIQEKFKLGIFDLENYLYKVYYERLNSISFKYNNLDEEEFNNFIRKYVDLINARTLAKLKAEKSKFNFEDAFLGGGKLSLSYFKSLENLELKKYLEEISKNFTQAQGVEEFSNVLVFDKEIGKLKGNTAKLLKKVSFSSPFFSMKYLFEVEKEMNSLRILLKSKYLGFTKEEILKLI